MAYTGAGQRICYLDPHPEAAAGSQICWDVADPDIGRAKSIVSRMTGVSDTEMVVFPLSADHIAGLGIEFQSTKLHQ